MLFLTSFCVHVLLGLTHKLEPSFDRSSPVSLSSIISDQLRNGRAFETSRSIHFSATKVVHGHQVLISSQHLHFEGTSTPFVHTSHLELTNIALLEDIQEPSSNSLGESTFVASLLNTSLSMEGFIFHVIASNHAMITVDSSSLTISKCTVLTEGSLSPFVISNGGGCSSSSISILSSQYEASSRTVVSLPPLTSLAPPLSNHPSTRDSSPDAFDAVVNVVHSSGLHLDDVHLGLGTGPLFDFGVLSSVSVDVPPTTISLTDSSLTNTSSLSPKTTRQLFPLAKQILVSCVVERCTNHFSGTAAADVNMCGPFLASNSSFEKCSSNLDESDTHPIYTLSHRTGTNLIGDPTDQPVEDVEITRCTFKDMSSSTTASAIQFTDTVGNTKIHECSFYDCNGTSLYGGTVSVSVQHNKYSVTFSSCIVVRCKGTNIFGGAVVLFQAVPLTCSDCVFFRTESTQFASALNILNSASVHQSAISNSIFECSYATSAANGSALGFRSCQNLLFSSLRFVDTQVADARDIFCHGMAVEINESCVVNCQSSRTSLICETSDSLSNISKQDDWFTTIDHETLVKSFVGSENEDGTATFTIEVEDEVTGEMVVLVENLDPIRSSSPPPIPRALTFSFPTAAKTASCKVVVGDTELIQSPVAEYRLRRAALSDWLVHTTLTVSSTAVSFHDEMKTIIDISLDCDGVVQAGYSILVKTGSTERNISLAVGSDRTSLTASGSISTLAGSVFTFSTDYTIVAVKDLWGSALVLPDAVSFTTPAEPPRLIKMTHSGLDSTGEFVIVTVRGRQMPLGTYTIELTSGGSFDVEFVAVRNGETLAERDSEPASVPIYGSEKILSFSTETSILRAVVKSTTTEITVVHSDTKINTPAEPARITAITGVKYDDKFTQLTLSFSGIKCPASGTTVTVKNTATQETYQFDVNFDTPQTGTRIETIWKEEGTTNLKFGATYEIVSVTVTAGEIFFPNGLSFDVVPARHRLLSASTVVFDDHRNVSTVPLKGDNMLLGNTTLKLVDYTHFAATNEYLFVDVEVSFTDDTDGLIEVDLYPNPQLVYDHMYFTQSMTRTGIDEKMFVTTQFMFKMPTEPSRLEKLTQVDHFNAEKEISLTWEGRLMTNGPYTVALSVNGSSTATTTLTLPFDSDGSKLTITESLYKSSLTGLKYNTTYVVTDVKDNLGTDVIYNPGITFTTNPEPTRLLSISSQVNCTDLNTTTLTLTGHQVATGDGTLTVVLSSVVAGSETDSDKIDLEASFSRSGDESTGTVLISLNPTPELAYGKTYRIVSLSSAKYIDTPLTFTTPSQPGRIKAVESLTYSELDTEVTITVTGVHCPSSDHIITLRKDGTSEETNLTFKCVSEQRFSCTATVWSATGEAELVEGATYTLVKTGTSGVFVDSGLKVPIGAASSRIVSLGAFTDGDDMNTTTIAVTGEKMSAGTYTLRFLDSTQFEATGDKEFVDTEIVFTTETKGTMLINLYPTPQLIYGHTYSIDSFAKPESVSEKVINHITTVTAPTEPSRLEGIAEEKYLNTNKTIELSWEGRLMKNGPYTVTLSVNGSSTTLLTLPFDSSESTSTTTETLFKSPSNGLKYSTTYVVTGVKDQSDKPVFYNSEIAFTTNAEPTRLMSLSGPVNTTGMNSTTLTLTGHQVPDGDAVLVVVLSSVESGKETESDKIELPVSFTRSGDDSTGTVSISLYPTSTLAYDQTYRIVSLSSADYIDTPLTFTMPAAPPRITGIKELTSNALYTEVTVPFEGIDFSTALACTLTFNNIKSDHTDTFEVNFKADQTGSGKLEMWKADGTSKVKQGETYEIVAATSSNPWLVFNGGMQFKVVEPIARVVSVGTTVDGDDLNTTTLHFVGENMPSGSYSVSLTDSIPSDSGETVVVEAEIVFESTTAGSMTVDLYPTPQLIYGHTYSITSFTKPDGMEKTVVVNHVTKKMIMPTEPSRLEKVTPVLSDDEKSVELTFEGRLFDSGEYSLTIQPAASNTVIIVPLTCNEDGTLSCSITTEGTDTPHVLFGELYTITTLTKDNNPIVINPKAKQFTVPISALLKSVSFEFTNSQCTSFKLVLAAENVTTNQNYTLMLQSGESFPVTFSTSKQGETASHPIGWSDTLQYGTEYEIADLIEDSSSSPMRKQTETFTTLKKPLNFTAFVDQSSVSDDVMCGDQLNPCGSIWKAWNVAVGLKHDEITLRILKETTETQPFVVSKDMSVLIENGKNLNAVFRIPASSTHSEGSGLITVNEGSLELKKVEVAVETASKSFVFLFGVNSIIVLENCVVDGVNIPLPNSDSLSVCEWKSGVIQLDNCETTIAWTRFFELPQGALHMKNGTITIDGSIFRDNTPNHDSFPSARRNIQCSDGGEVRIGTLTGGDGSQNTSSPWIALGNCNLNSTSVDTRKSLFIPMLDSNQTTSKSTIGFYEVSLVGSVLMPCGLGLEVVEWDEKKKAEKRSTRMDLTGLNSSEWTETSVSFKLNRSSIKDIDHSLELHAKLSFGQNQSTYNFFLLKMSDATAKKAHTLEQVKKMLIWLIPVIVVVVALLLVLLLVLICRRKRQQKRDAENLLKNREMDSQESLAVEKYDDHNVIVIPMDADHTNNMIHHNVPNTMGSHAVPQEDTLNKMDSPQSGEGVHGYAKTKMAVRCGEELVEVPVNVNNTLYNRLHKGGPPLDTQNVFRMITRGLAQLAKHNPQMPILTRLSPMWVFLDGDTPLFQAYDNNATAQTNIPESSFFRGSEHKTMNESLVPSIEDVKQTRSAANGSSFSHSLAGQSSDRTSDGQRWMAPEVADKRIEIDTSKASVFSLGLILWEMETGHVPFGEIDAVNAQRQLGTGSLPLMDSWTNESKIELVRRCLNLDPKERPTLEEICSLLDSDVELGKPAVEKQNVEEC